MKKIIVKIVLGVLIIVTSGFFSFCSENISEPPASGNGQYDFSRVDRFIEQSAGVYKNHVVVLVAQNGELIYQKEINMNKNTARAIASASKWLSGAVIMSLVDDNNIAMDDTVGKYLPLFTRYHKGRVTIRQLFSHTSGFPGDFPVDTLHGYEYREDLTLAEAVDSIAVNTPLIHIPGTTFNYGECSMQIAGRIAEVVSGKSWQALFDEKIAKPCEMYAAYVFSDSQNPIIGGGVRTTAGDYLHFVEMIVNGGTYNGNRVLSKNAVEEMLKDQTNCAVIKGTPYISNPSSPDPAASIRYGIGNWRDVLDNDGNALENSSPGMFGTHPWIDRKHNLAGIIFTITNPKSSNAVSLQVRELIREAVENAESKD